MDDQTPKPFDQQGNQQQNQNYQQQQYQQQQQPWQQNQQQANQYQMQNQQQQYQQPFQQYPQQNAQMQQPMGYQQQGFQQQQQMYPNQQMMMVQPGMPAMAGQQQFGMPQQQMFVDPDIHLLQQNGKERLRQMQQVFIIEKERNGCSDILWGGVLTSRWEMKSNQFSFNNLFNIVSQPFGTCADNIPGVFNSLQYDQQQRITEQRIFDVNHNRNCCFLKCCTGWWHLLGALNWCILSTICPSQSKIQEDGQKLATYKYSSCGSQTQIKDSNGNIKYIIKNKSTCDKYTKVLFDGSGQIISDCQIYIQYGGHKNNTKMYTNIKFSPNMTVEEKAILIYGCCKLS